MPRRSDLPLDELRPWLGHLALFDRPEEGRFRFRVCGTELLARFGCEATGLMVDDLPDASGGVLHAELERAITASVPITWSVSIANDGGETVYGEMALPLSDEDAHLSMLLLGSYPRLKD